MTARLYPLFEKHRERLKGRILDVGCYTGALYHWLGKPEGYTGIDIWAEAIGVAREFAPAAEFRMADYHDLEGEFDVVWSSQLKLYEPDIEKLKSLGSRHILLYTGKGHQGLREICG